MDVKNSIAIRICVGTQIFSAVFLLLSLLAAFPVCAKTYYVAPSGNDANNGNSWTDPFATISHAVGRGDVSKILVSNGTYVLTGEITVNKAVTIRSWNNGETDRYGTVIDGNYPNTTNRCFYLQHQDAVVDGFTITKGAQTGDRYGLGGGVRIVGGGMLTNCWITENLTEARQHGYGGGGIYMVAGSIWNSRITDNVTTNPFGDTSYRQAGGGVFIAGSGIVANCEISDNFANGYAGGGLYIRNGGMVRDSIISNNNGRGVGVENAGDVIRCIIINNEAIGHGGGAQLIDGGYMEGCEIIGNTAGRGGGVRISGAAVMYNCLIAGNTATDRFGGGIFAYNNNHGIISSCTIINNEVLGNETQQRGAGIAVNNTNHIYNCIVWSNKWTGTVGDHERDIGLYPMGTGYSTDPVAQSNSVHFTCSSRDPAEKIGENNITNHPVFLDSAAGNFHLQASSPCINVGTNQDWMTNALDLDGYPRIDRMNRQVDMGCYERVPRGMMFRSW